MKNQIIDSISEPFGRYPHTVSVSHHTEGQDDHETTRVALDSDAVNDDGSMNDEEIRKQVIAAIESK